MCDSVKTKSNYSSPQCQHFVLRKKRLCRMTVKPGKQYCGEHQPQPETDGGQGDTRIPCPNDPKHTCYVSKLDKHLSICNAREVEQPDYIIQNINAPTFTEQKPRLSLSEIPAGKILDVIEQINVLFEANLKDKIETLPEQPIHSAVLQEFNEPGRTESSLRHLRQASSLLHAVEGAGLVAPDTCYVELGAGKGQLACCAWRAWGQRGARVLLVDRAALRHKRDNRLRALPQHARLRADLAHLALGRVPAAAACAALVALAKHLCGAATDYALRCVTARGAGWLRGAVLATCCHHRCQRRPYPATARLTELGIDEDAFNIMLGLVSWATSGDGRRRRGGRGAAAADGDGTEPAETRPGENHVESAKTPSGRDREEFAETPTGRDREEFAETPTGRDREEFAETPTGRDREEFAETRSGRNREESVETQSDRDCAEFHARPIGDDPRRDVIISHSTDNPELMKCLDFDNIFTDCCKSENINSKNNRVKSEESSYETDEDGVEIKESGVTNTSSEGDENSEQLCGNDGPRSGRDVTRELNINTNYETTETNDGMKDEPPLDLGTKTLNLSKEQREEVGRRAKALLDWGRVLYLQECGFDARLVYYVPGSVSLENICIIATKRPDAVSE